MNRRILAFVATAVVVAAVAYVLFALVSPPANRTSTDSSSTVTGAPKSSPAPSAASPAAETPAPSPAAGSSSEPRRRAVTPKPAAAPTPDVAAPDPDLVTLHIDSDVPGAQVFVDRAFVGKAPVTTTDVKAGPHKVNVSAPGYEGVAKDVSLTPGSNDVVVNLREVRLNASLEVVHKHRMGSCKGRLVATPAGIRYETSDKDDAFRSGLLDLDTFEVDYLEKNLRIKLKQGKRLDFTDPSGNADHLFVFHRDVDKARERLKKGDPPAAQ